MKKGVKQCALTVHKLFQTNQTKPQTLKELLVRSWSARVTNRSSSIKIPTHTNARIVQLILSQMHLEGSARTLHVHLNMKSSTILDHVLLAQLLLQSIMVQEIKR